jgi:hypothetical protein
MAVSLRKWNFPNDGFLDIGDGTTTIDFPSTLFNRYRNTSVEILFTGITASDEGLTVDFYRANNPASFLAPNIESIGDNIELSAAIVVNTESVFMRVFQNIDSNFFRAVINAPVGTTANLSINVNAGGQAV